MEYEGQQDIGRMADEVRYAAGNGDPRLVESMPRDAIIKAAADGLVEFEVATLNKSEAVDLEQLGKEVNGCLKMLSDEERDAAQARADERLDELIDHT